MKDGFEDPGLVKAAIKGEGEGGEGKDDEAAPPQPSTPYDWGTFSWWKRVFFLDIDPLVLHGYSQRLEPEDMFVEKTVQTEHLVKVFDPAYAAAKQKENTLTPDMKRVLLAGNVPLFIFTGILYAISQACSLAGPLLLQRIVNGLQCRAAAKKLGFDPGCEPKEELYFYCIGLFMAPAVQSLCENQQTFLLYLIGTRMRNTLMAAIYRKCLRLSNSALQEESAGRVVTLMSNDAQKLQDAMMAIHAIWGAPAFVIAVLILLWFQVGWAMFVGLAILLILVPISGKLAMKLGELRRAIMQWTDKRVGSMNEIITGISMIKFSAWEVPFSAKVMGARNEEAKILKRTAAWQGLFALVLFLGPVMVSVFCFGSWTLAGNTLSNADAYTALSLFSLLRFPMSFLPMLVNQIINAVIALKRIGAFLAKPESSLPEEEEGAERAAPGYVKVTDGAFVWDDTQKESQPNLHGVNIEATPGTLTMVVGGVGSGKSSLLGALVGHMSKRAGGVSIGGSIGYVSQTAWIMNDTLQDNVLLGAPLIPELYKEALSVAQLGADLELLPNGDLTEIGDRGITLSGGQKQRVSIARAVYAQADVYLLDDPLSAVDSHVGRALFEKCIRGPLRNKTIILVTNALQHLPEADNIVWMADGTIRAQGKYDFLLEKGFTADELAHIKEDQEEKAAAEEANPGGMTVDEAAGPADENGKGGKGGRASMDARVTSGKVTLLHSKAANKNLTGIEAREEGNLSWDVVKKYFLAGGTRWSFALLLFLFTLEQGARVYVDRWVGIWFSDLYSETLGFYLGIYFAMGCTYGFITYIRSINFLFLCVRSAVSLHNTLLKHIMRLPKPFFDTNPAGRILNRFSRDMDIMDSTLPPTLIQLFGSLATYIAILIVIAIATKWFAIALVPLTVIYITIQRYYIPTSREVQRIESVSRSPIYSRFGEALLGVATIRAYRKEEHFTQVSYRLMEDNANAFVTLKLASAWLAMRLDLLGLLILTGCGALVIEGEVDPAIAGLALVYALDLTRFLKHGTNMASKAEADFNSVERITQYFKPDPEPPQESAPDVQEELDVAKWPSSGAIEVKDLHMRYRPNMPLVLQGVTFSIAGGENVGLVGRTGSGKSSIFLTLFRMVEVESGSIIIDGVDVKRLGVRHLRSKMSIIPQDPFMFSGTIRSNLDPFSTYEDHRIWEVLETVGLKSVIVEFEEKLGARVVDNGANFSLGQRQLFCMARAMLRQSKILMMDEATASVDHATDHLIQEAIRSSFNNCTILTIAHRLNTIMDNDKVVVLDAGRVVEAAHPDDLLQTPDGIFSRMVGQTGNSSARYLKTLASTAKRDTLHRAASKLNLNPVEEISSPDEEESEAATTRNPNTNMGDTPFEGPTPHLSRLATRDSDLAPPSHVMVTLQEDDVAAAVHERGLRGQTDSAAQSSSTSGRRSLESGGSNGSKGAGPSSPHA